MRIAKLLTILLAASASAKEPYAHSNPERQLTLPAGGFVGGALVGAEAWFPLGEDAFVTNPEFAPRGDLLLKLGVTNRVEVTLPLLLTVSLGDRTATELPEFALYGGLYRFRVPGFTFLPTAGASVRKRLQAVTLRGDLEARGTTPVRLSTMAATWKASALMLYAIDDRLSLGVGLTAEVGLQGPGRTPPGTPRTDSVVGRVYVGSSEDVPLLRLAATNFLDLDFYGQVSPGVASVEVRAAIGLRFLLNLQREPSPPTRNTAFPTFEGVEAE